MEMKSHQTLEKQIEQMAAQLEALTRKVEHLTLQVESSKAKPPGTNESQGEGLGDASEELLSWVGKSSLLQRLSTLCFLLVIALVLRTITDSDLIDLQIGSLVGMSYAALLMFMGWRRYRTGSVLAPVFTICGAVLMFTIVVETHAHFASLPSVPAYILLMLTGLGMAALSHFYHASAPISVGTLGMCLAGAAIDYPQPFFPHLGVLLLTANLLGYFTARAHKYSWLRWILLLVTMFMVALWGVKLGIALLNKGPLPHHLAPPFFLPVLAMISLTYPITAFLRIRNDVTGRLARFDLLAPTINAAGAFELARYIIFTMNGNTVLLGAVGVLGGLAHLELAHRLASNGKPGARGANAFIFAGVVLLLLASPVALGNVMLSLPFLSATAFGLALLAKSWKSGAVRWSSYFLQSYAAAALAFLFMAQQPGAYPISGALSSAILACLGLLQYKWCRSHRPPKESVFFSKYDKNDLSALSLLLFSLLSAFFMLRLAAHQFLVFFLPPGSVDDAFRGAQSVIINVSAAILMLFALAHRKKEVRNVAVLVTLIGAVKVFLYDLIGGLHGLPIVISVFSFGLTTALESFGLTRWHHLAPQPSDMSNSAEVSQEITQIRELDVQ